jgi:Uma2 family endonuclease
MPDGGRGFELVNGEPVEVTRSVKSNLIGGEIFFWVKAAAKSVGGDAFPPESGFRCFPDDSEKVRKPDTAYIAPGRLTDVQYDEEGFCTVVPDLVAEVISPHDLAYAVNERLEDWLAAGVKLIWVVHPVKKTVEVHLAENSHRLRVGDTLTADPVLSGFSLPLADLFARAGSRHKTG